MYQVHKKTSKKKKKGKKKGEFLPQKREKKKNKRTRLCKESRLEEDSFFLSSGRKPLRETTKEKKTHLNARRIKRREERERETGREGKRERRFIGRRRKPKRDGFGQTRRHSKAFAGGARGERDRDRGETRWVAVFETFRSFVFFFVLGGGARRTPGARFDRFLLGLFSMRRINLSTHTRSSSLFVWRRQKKRRESNKPKTKRRLRSNCTETNESNATSKWWRKPPVVPMK